MAYRVANSLANPNPYGSKSLAPNPYGSKTGPRGKFGDNPLDWIVGGASLVPGWRGSQALGNFQNLYGGYQSGEDWERFQGQVNANNREGDQLVQGIGAGRTGYAQDQARELQDDINFEANKNLSRGAIKGAFQGAFGGVNQSLSALPGQVNAQAGNALWGYQNAGQNIGNAFNQGAAGINAGYQDRLNTARGLVGQQSQQDRLDINRQYNQERAGQQQNLASQGLLGSTVGASIGGGIERQRRDALQRQSDQRLNQMLGVEGGFGGEALQAQTGLLGAGTNLRSGMASTGLQGGLNAAGIQSNVGLGAYGQMGNIAGQGFAAGNQAALDRINLRGQYGQYPINTGLDVAGMGLDWLRSGRTLIAPPGFNPISVQPYGGG